MAWRRPCDKPFSEPMMIEFTDAYVSLNELKYNLIAILIEYGKV